MIKPTISLGAVSNHGARFPWFHQSRCFENMPALYGSGYVESCPCLTISKRKGLASSRMGLQGERGIVHPEKGCHLMPFGHWATFCSSGTIGWEVWHSLDVENITVTARQLEPDIPFSRPPSLHQWGLGNLFFLSLQPSFSKVELRCFIVACLNHQFLCTNTLSPPHMHDMLLMWKFWHCRSRSEMTCLCMSLAGTLKI